MTDLYSIIAVELTLAGLLVASLASSILKRRDAAEKNKSSLSAIICVKRGPESWRKFGLAYGFASVLVLQLVNSSAAFVGGKVLISLLDLGALFYLCFFSAWFRSVLIERISAWENAPEW